MTEEKSVPGIKPFCSLAIPVEGSEEDLAELPAPPAAAGQQQEEMKPQKRSRSDFRLFMTVWGHRQSLWGSMGGLDP